MAKLTRRVPVSSHTLGPGEPGAANGVARVESRGLAAGAGPAKEGRAALGFGPHLVYDGFGCPVSRLEDLDGLYRLLDALPERIHMTRIMPPYVFRHRSAQGDEGYSGFVLIAESHISVHAFPFRRHVNVDIFSCAPFDVETALAELRQRFRPRRVEWKLLDRGREFPKQIAGSRAIVERDRRLIARGMGLEVSR